ncbi:MAG: DUF115 domain-containing protein [Desulfobacterales bacterium]|nr:DUF115 domain-containing protein [Desulfobacterales bacterium]
MNNILKQNLSILQKRNPNLLKTLYSLLPTDTTEIKIIETQSKDFTATAKVKKTGTEVLLHSLSNPWIEAQDILKGINIKSGELRVIMGMGLGYLPLEIIKNDHNSRLLIIEASPKIFEAALSHVDLKLLLESDRVIITLSIEENFEKIFSQNTIAINRYGMSVTTYEPERSLFPSFYQQIAHKITEQADAVAMTISSQKIIGKKVYENIIINTSTILKSANIEALKNSMQGLPAVIIGAGPSLKESIPILKKFYNKAFLIAVDSALPVLIKNGLSPHILVTLDYSEECYEKIRCIIDQTDNIPLFYLDGVNPLTVKSYKCTKKFFMSRSNGFLSDMRDLWGEWAQGPKMQGVAHIAFFMAVHSCASPIIFTGFDLAYTDFASHAEGMGIPVTINLDECPWVEGIDGKLIPSMSQFVGMRTVLEGLIKSYQVPCFNANKKGAKINGLPSCDLETFLSPLPYNNNIPEIVETSFNKNKQPEISTAIAKINAKIKGIKKISHEIQKIIELSEKSLKALKKELGIKNGISNETAKIYNRSIDEIGRVSNIIASAHVDDIYSIIAGELIEQESELQRLSEIYNDRIENKILFEKLKIIKTSLEVRVKGLNKLSHDLNELADRLSEEKKLLKELKNIQLDSQKKRILKALGNIYVQYKDPIEAENKLRESLKIDNNDEEALLLLYRTLIQKQQYKEAHDLIKNLNLKPLDFEEFNWVDTKLSQIRIHINNISSFINLPLAITYCQDILSCFPEHEEANKLLLEATNMTSKYQKDMTKLSDLLAYNEEEGILRADELIEKNETDVASRFLKIFIKKYPLNALARERLGLLEFDKGDTESAERLLIQAISLSPDRPETKIHLGAIYAEKGNFEEAYNYLIEAINLNPEKFSYLYEDAKAALEAFKKG